MVLSILQSKPLQIPFLAVNQIMKNKLSNKSAKALVSEALLSARAYAQVVR